MLRLFCFLAIGSYLLIGTAQAYPAFQSAPTTGCVTPSPEVVTAIRRGLRPEDSALKLVAARATSDDNSPAIYYVSTQLEGAGTQQVNEVATWVLSGLDASSAIASLNQTALRLTTWPRALVGSVPIDTDSPAAQTSQACTLGATRPPLSVPGLIGVFGWAGWIFGLFSGGITFRAYMQQRRTTPALDQILRDYEGKLTVEEVKALETRLSDLRREMNIGVPREARRAALETQRETLAVSLGDLYMRYQQIENQIGPAEATSSLGPNLLQAIQKEIAPYYAERRRLRSYLYVLLTLVIGVLFYPSVSEFLLRWLYSSTQLPISPFDLTAYLGGIVIASMLAFFTLDRWWHQLVRWLGWISVPLGAASLGAWLLFLYTFVVYFGAGLSPDLQNLLAVLSLAPFAAGLRLLAGYYRGLRDVALRKPNTDPKLGTKA